MEGGWAVVCFPFLIIALFCSIGNMSEVLVKKIMTVLIQGFQEKMLEFVILR